MALAPRPPNMGDVTPTDNDLIIGDPHGDLDGVKAVLKAANWNPDTQRIFTVGDNIDRGHQSPDVLKFLEDYGGKSIMGNHDWWHVRNANHTVNEALTGKKNPMKTSPEKQDTIKQFGEDYANQALKMKDYPLYLPFQDSQGKGYIVHGGIDPYHQIEEQQPDKMLVRRHHPMPTGFMEGESDEHPYWQRSYQGHLGHIIHGHNPSPSHDFHGNPDVTSLDGGGVFGRYLPWVGRHRAMRLGDRKIFEAPGSEEAYQNYMNIRAQGGLTH